MMFAKFELHQMKVNAERMPNCIGKLRKVISENSNWEIYYDTQYKFFRAIAKPSSGAEDSCYGDAAYIRKQIRDGRLDSHLLTKFGKKILGI